MNFLRYLFVSIVITLVFSCKEPPVRPVVRLLPLPAEIVEQKGVFLMNHATAIVINKNDDQLRRIASFLSQHTEKFYGITNNIEVSESEEGGSINLRIDEALKLGTEDYTLSVTSGRITIEASAPNGIFYGIQTLIQLMPSTSKQSQQINLPTLEIKDAPRFAWRGIQLDVSRHFMPKEFIFKFLDEMAMHKLNVFDWHLADDQGWRIEINKYPRLTEVGSIRPTTIRGHIAIPIGTDTIPTGGFYSQSDIREIVSYASDRFITVVPGIEMPGHALAALASYPELGCTEAPYQVASRWGMFNEVYCAGKENTYVFIREVLSEITSLFPGKYIQIGGAECETTRWEKCPACQHKIKTDSLESTQALHQYFVRRVEGIVDSLGKEMVGWDDIIKDTLINKSVVKAWHGDLKVIDATNRKMGTVICPARYFNFDQYQAGPKGEPLAVGGMLTIEDVYKFNPIPADLPKQNEKYIMGIEANLWTAYMKSPEFVEYMMFPRTAALAELCWSPKGDKNYPWFRKRLAEQIKRYEANGIKYCKSEFE